jgi:hypothetical protein
VACGFSGRKASWQNVDDGQAGRIWQAKRWRRNDRYAGRQLAFSLTTDWQANRQALGGETLAERRLIDQGFLKNRTSERNINKPSPRICLPVALPRYACLGCILDPIRFREWAPLCEGAVRGQQQQQPKARVGKMRGLAVHANWRG